MSCSVEQRIWCDAHYWWCPSETCSYELVRTTWANQHTQKCTVPILLSLCGAVDETSILPTWLVVRASTCTTAGSALR